MGGMNQGMQGQGQQPQQQQRMMPGGGGGMQQQQMQQQQNRMQLQHRMPVSQQQHQQQVQIIFVWGALSNDWIISREKNIFIFVLVGNTNSWIIYH